MIGQLLDKRYRILQVLGAGAFGKTYLAADLRRPGYPQCVVKQLRLLRPNPTAVKNAHRLFQREAEMLEKLGTHSQVPRLLAYFEEGKQFYLVKEFTPGHPLSKEMPPGEPLPEHRVIGILVEILEVLTFVHSQSAIHRDIKPANLIRRNSDGKLVLIDFGSVKEIIQQQDGEAAARTIAAGTPAYMPIEQFYGTPRLNSDLFAVGMIAIQALGGLSSEQLQKLRGDRDGHMGKLEWRSAANTSPGLASIIDKMVHHSHAQRYQSANDALVDLYEFANIPIEDTALLSGGLSGSSSGGLSGGLSTGRALAQSLPTQQQEPPSRWARLLRSRWFPVAVGGSLLAVGAIAWQLQVPQRWMAAYYRSQGEAILEPVQPERFSRMLSAASLNKMSRQLAADKELLEKRVTDYSQAIDHHTQALSWSPEGTGFFQRGAVHFARREWRAAVTDLDRALQLDGQNPAVHLYLGQVRRVLGDRNSALKSFNRAVELDPQFTAAYLGRGFLQLDRDQREQAVKDFKQVLEQQPNWGAAHRGMCQAQAEMKNWEVAITQCSQAIKLDSNDAIAYQLRGQAHFQVEELQGALSDLNVAIGLAPDQAAPYYFRAIARQALNEIPGTLEDLNQTILLDPDYALAYYQRGLLQQRLKNRAAAEDDFRQAAKLCLDRGEVQCYRRAQAQLAKNSEQPVSPQT